MQSIKDTIESVVGRHRYLLGIHADVADAIIEQVVTELEAREAYQAEALYQMALEEGIAEGQIEAAFAKAGLPALEQIDTTEAAEPERPALGENLLDVLDGLVNINQSLQHIGEQVRVHLAGR